MARTMNQVIREVTLDYLKNDIPDVNNPPSPSTIESTILERLAVIFELENSKRQPGNRWRIMQKLNFMQIADIMAYLYRIVCVKTAGPSASSDFDLLAVYQTDGQDEGIYVTDTEVFRRIAKDYNYTITKSEFEECMIALRDLVPHKVCCRDKDLIAVNNGIFDYETKQLMPFDPDFIFLNKSRVNYNDMATNVVIHNNNDNTDWDVESWIAELSDDPEITNLLWQILGAIIRPNVSWNKSAWFYSEKGNNGKGTLCLLMQQLCGEGSYVSLKLDEMGKDFALEPLIRATAIITDENDVGTYIDKAANLKSLITNDTIQINRKFKTPIPYKFYGFMVQCLNEMPRVRDKSDSFFRRQIFVPFTKCFTGRERKYIKNDYLKRTEVLEYVLYKVLNMNYYDFDEPQACKDALDNYKEFNDPVRQFFNEIVVRASWDILPFGLLYDMYIKWFKKNNPSGTPQNKSTFTNDIITVTNQSEDWICRDRRAKLRIGNKMSCCEPLLDELDLKDWQNPKYKNTAGSMEDRCTPAIDQFTATQRGIYRINPINNAIPIEIIND